MNAPPLGLACKTRRALGDLTRRGRFDGPQNAGGDRKRISSTLTRVWSSLLSYFRPPRDILQSGFRWVPYPSRHIGGVYGSPLVVFPLVATLTGV